MRAATLAALLASLGLGASACGGHTRAASTTTTTAKPAVERPVPASFAPVALSVPSASDIWVLGTARCASRGCVALAHSTDSGVHFSAVDTPAARKGTLDSIRFVNKDDGYLYDGHAFGKPAPLWETSDGGTHWHRAGFADLIAFTATNREAFVVTATCADGKCHGLELRTAPLGANTWSATDITSIEVDPIVSLTARGSSIWFAVSDTSLTSPAQTLIHSTNAGETFTTEKSPCVPGLGGSLAATSATVLWADCPTGMLGAAYRTVDAGRTWSTLDVGREIANSSQLVPSSNTNAVLATGDQAQLLQTTDGGTSFRAAQSVSAGFWNLIEFADETHGFALRIVGDNWAAPRLYASGDGGATWRLVPLR